MGRLLDEEDVGVGSAGKRPKSLKAIWVDDYHTD
jgi:hypothetical protein